MPMSLIIFVQLIHFFVTGLLAWVNVIGRLPCCGSPLATVLVTVLRQADVAVGWVQDNARGTMLASATRS